MARIGNGGRFFRRQCAHHHHSAELVRLSSADIKGGDIPQSVMGAGFEGRGG
jgi:hypothetical protein